MLEEIRADKIEDIYLVEENKKNYYNISKNNSYETMTLFFRGQADYNWILEASIKRDKNYSEFDVLKSYNSNNEDLFAYIARCQHYNKKTRFLDFSTNIDVALFFACYDEKYNDMDAALFVCPYIPRKIEWCDTIIISELSLLKTEITVGDFADELFNKYSQIKQKFGNTTDLSTTIVSWLDHGFIVLPDNKEYEKLEEKNTRIVVQQGAFFICGNKTKSSLDSLHRTSSFASNNIILPEIAEIPVTINNSNHVSKIKIPSILKRDIISYLDNKGISFKKLLCD